MQSPEKAIYWPYNSFGFYHEVPIAGYSRAKAFCDKWNQCKGGRWEVHTKEQYDDWFRRKGQHLEYLHHHATAGQQ